MHKFVHPVVALLGFASAMPGLAAVPATGCGRLSTGDTYSDLNKILDCIEAKAAGEPATAASGASGYVEEQEPNDRIGDANPLALGTRVRGRIKQDNEFDVFRFKAPAADGTVRIIIRQTQTEGFFPHVTLYDDQEVKVAEASGSANTMISQPLDTEANRSYYIVMSCRYQCDSEAMDYELVVTTE